MRTFSVKTFERFQHYKDRNPPWIKLYNELLDDYEFGCLQDASKLHLILIWLLASRSENKLPYDPTWVGRRINASEPVDLDELVRRGFLLLDQPLHNAEQVASEPLADCLPRDRERDRGRDRARDRDREKVSAAPVGARSDELDLGKEPDEPRSFKAKARAPPSDPEVELFRRGREVLGDKAGGMISQLLKAKVKPELARAAIEQASTKDRPREYIGAIIRGNAEDERPSVIL
jgi:hypothetical protein